MSELLEKYTNLGFIVVDFGNIRAISAIERAVSYRMLLIPHEFCTLQRIEMEHFSTFRGRLNEATHACVLTSAQLHTHLDELYQNPFAWKIALIRQSQSTLKF